MLSLPAARGPDRFPLSVRAVKKVCGRRGIGVENLRRGAPGGYRPRMDGTPLTITDQPDASRFEARAGATLAGFVEYRRRGVRVVLLHTEVPPAFAGRGVGAALARHIFEGARAEGIRVSVRCPFLLAWLERHPEFADQVLPGPPGAARDAGAQPPTSPGRGQA